MPERVCAANRAIGEMGLAPLTWGNASACDRYSGTVVIKPSGVAYADLTPDSMVLVDLEDGQVKSEGLQPSTDTETHLILYRRFPDANGIVHTHSKAATAWAQACRSIPCLGTTHADHFCGPIPVTRDLTNDEVEVDYVGNTGHLIVETCDDPVGIPAVLVARHAPFVWGSSIEEALENAVALELIAEMAISTVALSTDLDRLPVGLLKRHFERKHGPDKTYGQT